MLNGALRATDIAIDPWSHAVLSIYLTATEYLCVALKNAIFSITNL